MGWIIGRGIGVPFRLGSSQKWSSYWTRPLGTTYGTGDGSSYDNAWSGFDEIDWGVMKAGDTLYVCGIHTELLTIGTSGDASHQLNIRFDYETEAGAIDAEDTRNQCLNTNGKNYLTIKAILANKTLYDAAVSCSYIGDSGVGIIFDGVWADGSGNEAFQNVGCTVIYNNCKGSGSVDDGLSGHENTVLTCNDCEFSGNAQGINAIINSQITCNRTVIKDNTNGIVSTQQDIFIFNNCKISDTISADGDNPVYINNSILLPGSTIQGKVTITDSYCLNTNMLNLSTTHFIRCYIKTNYNPGGGNGIYINGNAGALNGTLVMDYCILKLDDPSVAAYILQQISTNTITCNNCTFVGYGTTEGRLLHTAVTGVATLNNCIMSTFKNGTVNYSSTPVLNYCNLYNITTPTFGTTTNNNPVTGDPKLKADYSLDTGSVAIGSGVAIEGKETGIASANWGDGDTTYPVVITKVQAEAWDLGAIIS
jgi:hypothetical protein